MQGAARGSAPCAGAAPAELPLQQQQQQDLEQPCSRCQPYNHQRRGHRAPDALAVALAKRAFVQALPYRVGTAPVRLLPGAAGRLPQARSYNAGQWAEAAGAETPKQARLLSLAERYEAMTRTVAERLTMGAQCT